MSVVIYTQFKRPPKEKTIQKVNPEIFLETSGYESRQKTIDRMMIAGYRLYNFDRNYQVAEGETLDGVPLSPTKFDSEMDVIMARRAIMERIRRKVNAQLRTKAASAEAEKTDDSQVDTGEGNTEEGKSETESASEKEA